MPRKKKVEKKPENKIKSFFTNHHTYMALGVMILLFIASRLELFSPEFWIVLGMATGVGLYTLYFLVRSLRKK